MSPRILKTVSNNWSTFNMTNFMLFFHCSSSTRAYGSDFETNPVWSFVLDCINNRAEALNATARELNDLSIWIRQKCLSISIAHLAVTHSCWMAPISPESTHYLMFEELPEKCPRGSIEFLRYQSARHSHTQVKHAAMIVGVNPRRTHQRQRFP